jgi:hypothetical protein
MLKDATYKEKCLMLKSWMPQILETVKKDLKNEHLKNDFKFIKKYFAGKNINKLTTQDYVDAYLSALEQEENGEEIAEFVTNRWLTKNTELYDYFEKSLSQISQDFTQLTEIDPKKSQEIVDGAVQQYGAPRTYLFSVMNSVVFPKEVYEKLDHRAKEVQKKSEQEETAQLKHLSHENMKQHYEEQILRLTDKYEKKLSGFERKYFQDMEALKKQIVALQKRINAGQ